jgi:hypothetical protein
MKLLYLGTGLDSAHEVIGDRNLLIWNPPGAEIDVESGIQIQSPVWEFGFEGNIWLYTDSNIVVIIEEEEESKLESSEGKVAKMHKHKRGTSTDHVLENK